MAEEPDILERAVALRAARRRVVLVTVVETRGSTPRKAGAKMLVFADGTSEGTVGGGAVEHVIKAAARRVLRTEKPELVPYNLTADLQMGCGGAMTLFVEPVVNKPTLILFGCGHVNGAVLQAALPLGFDVVVVDDLDANTGEERMAGAARVVRSFAIGDLQDLPFGPDTYVVIATRDHSHDAEMLDLCLQQEYRYLGVIGSGRKAAKTRARLAEAGVDAGVIERLRCPIGIDIGAQTPEEIAVSICADLISSRRGGPHWGKTETE